MHQLIPTTLFCVGLTTHIGLAVPKPFQTVWEQVTTDERRAHSIVEGNVWSKVGLAATKSVVWTCVLCELVSVTLRDAPHSSAAVKLTSWLPSTVIHYLQSITLNTSRFTVSQYIGLALLTAGAFVHLAARLSLSEYVVFPLISSNSRPRMLYVPPSLIPPEATSIDSPLPILEPPKPEVAWSLRVSHRLITKGPYAHVRHPMYFGAFITFIGTGFFHFSKGAFLRTVLDTLSSNLNPQGNLFSWIGIGLAGVIAFETTFGLAKRAAWEDVALQERFGKEYSVYRWRVPYGFVPGIY